MNIISLNEFKTLKNKINWGPVEAEFVLGHDYPMNLVSNVSIVPTVGDNYVIIRSKDGKYELPGGTLEPNETIMDGLAREVIEEVGSRLIDYHIVGYFLCRSSSEKPYRAHIPHPEFVRLFGYGEVQLLGKPTNPADGEQIEEVEIMGLDQAVNLLITGGRHDIADLYKLAHRVKNKLEIRRRQTFR